MLKFSCSSCNNELETPGAILLIPNVVGIRFKKKHICCECYNAFLASGRKDVKVFRNSDSDCMLLSPPDDGEEVLPFYIPFHVGENFKYVNETSTEGVTNEE